MTYTYLCESCGKETEIHCTIAEMKREIPCSFCSKPAKKIIDAPALVGVSSSNSSFKKDMTKRNQEAGKRMRGSHKSVKT